MTIAGLISGGVDSAVMTHLLCEQGYTPDLFYIKIGSGPEGQWDCTEEEDWEMSCAVARRYGLRIEKIDLQHDYWDRVVGYIADRLRRGLTPNSDVMCNRLIKFGCFEERVGYAYDRIATGHYARTESDEAGRTWLCTAPDPVKDQTDFLSQLPSAVLQKAMFPVGSLTKEEVRRIAAENRLAPAHRRDSQGICFLGKLRFADLAKEQLGEREGIFVEQETGNVLGKHNGYWFFTIGQRKGIGLGGGPWYVVRKDIRRNIVYLSRGYQTPAAYSDRFCLSDPNWLTVNPFSAPGNYPVRIKIRHTPEFVDATLSVSENAFKRDGVSPAPTGAKRQPIGKKEAECPLLRVTAAEPLQGVAPGQFCTIYDTAAHRCFGGAEIAAWKGKEF